MKRWLIVGGIGIALLFVVGMVATYVPRLRVASDQTVCANNLREIALFAAHHASSKPGRDIPELLHQVPSGTIVLPGAALPPEERLSWVALVLPGLNQKRQKLAELVGAVDVAKPWSAAANQAAARVRLLAFVCPGAPAAPAPDEAAPGQYVGISGLGADSATLTLLADAPTPPRAGCFRYDQPTPFPAITDGLSQTLLLGERSTELGPWLRGGPATVRGLDDAAGAAPLFGAQFGGCHPNGANWAMADGGVRFLTVNVDPKVLFSLATIAGKGQDPLPGE